MTPDRDRLLDAALSHVPFEGMNERALIAGARDIGMAADLARVHFPDAGAGLAAAYHRRGDARLAEAMAGGQPAQGRIRDRIAAALWQRLALSDPELVRAGAATLALPQNAALGARLVWETADTIWTGLGDRSEDVSWWTKRATLASVWGAVVLYWLGDASEGRIDTRAKLPKGKGIWPAIWMLGSNDSQVSWPACGEIDIMELQGSRPNVNIGTIHFGNSVATKPPAVLVLRMRASTSRARVFLPPAPS